VLGLGTASGANALREGLALGCDEALLLCDPAFDNGDSYTTALALAKAMSFVPYDLILCGERADDTQAGQVGTYMAQILGIPLLRNAVKIDVDIESRTLLVQRKLGKGDRERVECLQPALVTVEADLNRPRYPTAKAFLRSKAQSPQQLDARRLGLSPQELGSLGSKVRLVQLTRPRPRMKGLLIPDSRLSPAERLRLISEGGITAKESHFLEGKPPEVASQLIQFFKRKKIMPRSSPKA
jgi:electron transfer flavoprotein beta subunit